MVLLMQASRSGEPLVVPPCSSCTWPLFRPSYRCPACSSASHDGLTFSPMEARAVAQKDTAPDHDRPVFHCTRRGRRRGECRARSAVRQ